MSYEKKKKFIVNVAYYSIIVAMFFLALKYVFSWLMPFVLAFGVSILLRPASKKISQKLKLKYKFSAFLCCFLFYGITLALIVFAGFNSFGVLKNLFFSLPQIYTKEIEPVVYNFASSVQESLIHLDPSLEGIVEDFLMNLPKNLGNTISTLSVKALSLLSGIIAKVPSYFIKTIITVIATFFVSGDYEKIAEFTMRQLPYKWQTMLIDIKQHTATTLIKYISSYARILSVTFIELFAALALLKVNNAFVLAFFIAIFDILPILGVGGIIIPWGILALVQGKYAFALGMLATYIIITVVRQIIEPKIIGDQVGLHPVVTLVAMFIGAKFFGVVGLFLLPICLVIVKKLNDSEKISIFK